MRVWLIWPQVAEPRLNSVPYWDCFTELIFFLLKRTCRSQPECFNSVWGCHRNTALSHFCVYVSIDVSRSFCCSLFLVAITTCGPSGAPVLDLALGTAFWISHSLYMCVGGRWGAGALFRVRFESAAKFRTSRLLCSRVWSSPNFCLFTLNMTKSVIER